MMYQISQTLHAAQCPQTDNTDKCLLIHNQYPKCLFRIQLHGDRGASVQKLHAMVQQANDLRESHKNHKDEGHGWEEAKQGNLDPPQSMKKDYLRSSRLESLSDNGDFGQVERADSSQTHKRQTFTDVGLSIAEWPH